MRCRSRLKSVMRKTLVMLVILAAFPCTFATVRSATVDQDISAQVSELKQSIEEIRSAQGIDERVRQLTLKRLVDQLGEVLRRQRDSLVHEKSRLSNNTNLSANAKARLAETYDQLIGEVSADLEKYSAANILRNASLAGPPSSVGADEAVTARGSNLSNVGGVRRTENDNDRVKVCGQIRPASLTQIFAIIGSLKPDLIPETHQVASSEAVRNSTLGNQCDRDGTTLSAADRTRVYEGSQKDAVVATLQAFLDEIKNKAGVKAAIDELRGDISEDTIKRQILLLQGYIGNAKVIVEGGPANSTPPTLLTDKDGNYFVELPPGKYYFSTEADASRSKREIQVDGTSLRVNLMLEDRPPSLLSRAVVGYEQSGTASAKKSQNWFFDLFVNNTFPIRQKIDPDFGERLRTWTDFRFASVPQSGDVTIGDLSTGPATQISGLKVKDVANVFEFLGGLEYRIGGNASLLPSFDGQTKQKFSWSLIASAGITTPTNSLDSLTVFKVFPDAPGLPPEAKNKEFIAFVQSDRDRFFRQYYLGLRLQTFFFNPFNMPMQRFPAQFDISIGQNEFVTGGKLKGPVIRIEGYFPLPYENAKFVNIFGTALLRPGHSNTGIPLILQDAPAGTVVPAANVFLFEVPQPNRDYYRVGIGWDFISFVQKLKEWVSNH